MGGRPKALETSGGAEFRKQEGIGAALMRLGVPHLGRLRESGATRRLRGKTRDERAGPEDIRIAKEEASSRWDLEKIEGVSSWGSQWEAVSS